jgi:hypothetical protein
VLSYQIFIENNHGEEVGPWGAFKAGSDFNHPVSHLGAVLLGDIMPLKWITTGCLSFLLFECIAKKCDILDKFL